MAGCFFDHVHSHPELIVNVFKEAVIVEAIEKSELSHSTTPRQKLTKSRPPQPMKQIHFRTSALTNFSIPT